MCTLENAVAVAKDSLQAVFLTEKIDCDFGHDSHEWSCSHEGRKAFRRSRNLEVYVVADILQTNNLYMKLFS